MEIAKYDGSIQDLQITSCGDVQVLTINEDTQIPLFSRVPFWASFIQPGSVKNNKKFKGHAGHFYFSGFDADEDSDEEVDENDVFSPKLRVIPIGLSGYSRALMPEWEPGGDTEPLCKSQDGVWPSPRIVMPRAAKCGTWDNSGKRGPYLTDICPEGKWVNGVKPACKKTENWMFFDIDRKCPIMLPLSGTNISPFKALSKKLAVLQLKAITKGADIKDYFVQIMGEDKGTYYQMQFSFAKAEDAKPSEYLAAVAWYQENVLPSLGVDPEKPVALGGGDDAQGVDRSNLSKEDEAALEAEAAEAEAKSFEV